MKYKLLLLFCALFFLVSCSNEEENIIVAGKDLASVTHVFYNYVYPDQPATRTYTTNYTFKENKITDVRSILFHYWHEEPERNYNAYDESIFSYDNRDRLIKVTLESYSDIETEIFVSSYELNYDQNDRIKEVLFRDNSGELRNGYYFEYNGNIIERKLEYYEDGNMIFYSESILFMDSNERIYSQTSKGPIFQGTDPNSFGNTTHEATFNDDGNVYQTFFEGSPLVEYVYSDIRIPSDLPDLRLPFFNSIPYTTLLGQFDQIVESYNTNYINTIISLEPTNQFNTNYKNSLSNDNYPLKIELYINDQIRSKTTYTYE